MSKLDITRAEAIFSSSRTTFTPADVEWVHGWASNDSELVVALADKRHQMVWARATAMRCGAGLAYPIRWPAAYPWAVHSSALHSGAFARGWGTAMYLELFADLARRHGHVTIGNDWCCGGGTSPQAQATWQRLARLFPQTDVVVDPRGSGGCWWIKLAPRAVLAAQRQWAARMSGSTP